jgi:putative pyruvate formate lyase activating enzyme
VGGLIALGCRERTRRPGRQEGPPEIDRKTFRPAYLALEESGELKRREEKVWSILTACRLCPRQCGVNRLRGETGRCSSTAELKLASYGPHFGEERPLVGRKGSGTVFFANCNLLCVFCQNWQTNHRGDGVYVTQDTLADAMLSLQKRGCHNINLVTPTHVAPHIFTALRKAIAKGLRLPLVYNTGAYDNPAVIELLDGVVDIYLPDCKYMDGAMAKRFSHAPDYPGIAQRNIREMNRQVGRLRVDDEGIAGRGLMVRHLVMPNHVAGTREFVKWVARDLGKDTYVNIMGQYWPAHQAAKYPKIARPLSRAEHLQALRWAKEAGLTNLDRGS